MNETTISNIQQNGLMTDRKIRLNAKCFNLLPLETTINIFSYLNQTGCLTTMTVCRDWYQNVPRYNKNVWKKVRMIEHDGTRLNQGKELCLEQHVKVEIFEKFVTGSNVLCIMERLIQLDCIKIESMGKYQYNFFLHSC